MVKVRRGWVHAGHTKVVSKKVCLVGAFAVGKTSLVRRSVENIYDDAYLTTVGVKVDRTQVQVGATTVNMMLWDLAGEDAFTELRIDYIRGASGFVLVADGTRPETLDQAIALKNRIYGAFGPLPFVLALNKADLVDSWSIPEAHYGKLGHGGRWSAVRTSARTGTGVAVLLSRLARSMVAG